MDLGAPEAFLGLNVVAFVCISAVLAMLCKQNHRNVRGTNYLEVKTTDICIWNSGSESHWKREGDECI